MTARLHVYPPGADLTAPHYTLHNHAGSGPVLDLYLAGDSVLVFRALADFDELIGVLVAARAEYGEAVAAHEARPLVPRCICARFGDTGGFRVGDLTCPVHGEGGSQPLDGPWDEPGRLCELPADCPLGPEPHEFVPPEGPGMCCTKQPWEDAGPLPDLPRREPGGALDALIAEHDGEPIVITRDELLADWRAAHPGECSCPVRGFDGPGEVDRSCPRHGDPEPQPGGTVYPELSPEALAGGKPLESLAADPEDSDA